MNVQGPSGLGTSVIESFKKAGRAIKDAFGKLGKWVVSKLGLAKTTPGLRKQDSTVSYNKSSDSVDLGLGDRDVQRRDSTASTLSPANRDSGYSTASSRDSIGSTDSEPSLNPSIFGDSDLLDSIDNQIAQNKAENEEIDDLFGDAFDVPDKGLIEKELAGARRPTDNTPKGSGG